ncbi:hypothetical protein IQ06DRAFT_280372 [Phaeosphaeriaceae sp. SRC1lsM3a]|nr:hypothetical protein IQ06DRAFT_280372 [Stagonospora sp. SRC1lsM3a]
MHTPPVAKTSPRIEQAAAGVQKAKITHPAAIFDLYGQNSLRPATERQTFLRDQLETPRLNAIHDYLWLAGLPVAARPLHRQILLGRTVFITERPDEHLVWFETQIFIKPLPDYLLNYDYWLENLCDDDGEDLYQSACGMLLSYAWLICYESDLNLAKEIGLMHKDVEWPSWTAYLEEFLANMDRTSSRDINKRYNYGELRLSRLNAIYRWKPPSHSLRNLMRGYRVGSMWYNVFFKRHFGWLFAVFGTFSVCLSALQVGLSTSKLQLDERFQRMSYGLTMISLVVIIAVVMIILVAWVILFWYHLITSWRYNKATEHKRHRSTDLS